MRLSTNTGLHSARKDKERYSVEETCDFLAAVGFRCIEMNFCASIYKEPFRVDRTLLDLGWQSRMERLRERLDNLGVEVPYAHLPFYRFEEEDRANSFEYELTLRAIKAGAILGVKWAVVHPSKLEDEEGAFTATKEYLESLLEAAHKYDVRLAVENLPLPGLFCSNVDALCSLVDSFGGAVGICWDTGHGNITETDQAASLRRVGERVKMLHLHDNFGSKDEHSLPYCGTVSWEEVMAALADIGFSGHLNFEVSASRVPEPLREAHGKYLHQVGSELLELYARVAAQWQNPQV